MKLNLGCGNKPLEGYENIDRKNGQEAYPLNCSDNSVDEIRASHILEHFSHKDVLDILRHWTSKLKTGGVLKVAVPDFGKIAKFYLDGEKINTVGYLMGGQTDKDDYHHTIFDKQSLYELLKASGLEDIQEWQDAAGDCSSLPISLNLMGTKKTETVERPVKINAVMSMPRLAFTENLFSAMRAFIPLGINLDRGTGVFWGQVLTRMIEQYVNESDFIITCDYDTWFTKNHVQRLCQLMMEHPEVDALVPVQIKREGDNPLMGMRAENGGVRTTAKIEEFKQPLTPIGTGHFGLTIFRSEVFKKLPKPWFLPIPNSDGRWEENRIDEDIYFWNKFREVGLKAYLANEVNIGHIQLMCTMPGTPEESFKPSHLYMSDVEKGKFPSHCEPKIELMKGQKC